MPIIEAIEPKLLLSAVPINADVVKSLQANLGHLQTTFEGMITESVFNNALPLLQLNESSAAGKVLGFDTIFKTGLIDPITSLIEAEPGQTLDPLPVDSAALASLLTTKIRDVIGNAAGDLITIVDNSINDTLNNVKLLDFSFTVKDEVTKSFTIDLGDAAEAIGLTIPKVTGTVGLNYEFTFKTSIDINVLNVLGAAATATTTLSAFALADASFKAGFQASADLTGAEVRLGMLTLSMAPGAAGFNFGATFTADITGMTGTALGSNASAISGGDKSSLQGAGAIITASIDVQTDGTATPLMDLPLTLSVDKTIPGIPAFSTPVNLKVIGMAAEGNFTITTDDVVAGIRTAIGVPDFDPRSLSTMSPADMVVQLAKVVGYVTSLAGVDALELVIPFTNGLTVGEVIDFGTAFKTSIIDPLNSALGIIGLTEGQVGTGGVLQSSVLSVDDIKGLPDLVQVQLTLADGKTAALKFTPNYVDSNFVSRPVNTVSDLAIAMNQAIKAGALAGLVIASNDGGRLTLTTTAPSGSTPSATLTATTPVGAVGFSTFRDFGVGLGKILKLQGWDDTTLTRSELGQKMLDRLGLNYDAEKNAITFGISKEFTLADITVPMSFNLDLAGIAGVSLENASLKVGSSVLLNLTAGFSLDPYGNNVNKPGGPVLGDGQNGTTDVKIGDLPVYVSAFEGGAVPLTANQVADANDGTVTHTTVPDLRIIGRDGLVRDFVLTPDMTISNLDTAVENSFGARMAVQYNVEKFALQIIDTQPADTSASPSKLGIPIAKLASSAKVGTTPEFSAVLAGTPPEAGSPYDFNLASKFILSVGKLPPIVVSVSENSGSASGVVTKINASLNNQTLDRALLGLEGAGTLKYSDIVAARVGSNGQVELFTKIYSAILNTQGEAPNSFEQRTVMRSGIRVDDLTLMTVALNSSKLPSLLGLVGTDFNGGANAQGVLTGLPLHGQNIFDRFYFQDTGISATIDAAVMPTDPGQNLTLSGTLAGLQATATLYDAADPTTMPDAYVSLRAALMLNYEGNAEPNTITFRQLGGALLDGQFGDIWSFNLESGRQDEPFAKLRLSDIKLNAGSIALNSVSSPEIIITLDNPENLLELKAPTSNVEVTGVSTNLAIADVIEAVRQVFQSLNSDVANQEIPLINVSLDEILGFGTKFILALDQAQQDPSGAVSSIQDSMNRALGGQYVTLSYDAQDNLLFSISYTPVAVTKQLPFNLDLSSVSDLLGSDGAALASLIDQIGSVASVSASGNLDISAAVKLAMTLGFNLGDNSSPALLTDRLSKMNGGEGIRPGTAGQPTLQFTLGSGRSFTVNTGTLADTATVQDLLTAINTAAGGSGFATYDATTGELIFSDASLKDGKGVTDLGFTDGQQAVSNGKTSRLVAGSVVADPSAAYTFAVKIGVNVTGVVVIEADAARTTMAGLVDAVRDALAKTTVSAQALLNQGSVPPGSTGTLTKDFGQALGTIVKVGLSGGKLAFTAADAALGEDNTGNLINRLSVAVGQPKMEFKVESINDSKAAEDLGLGGNSVSTTETVSGERVIKGKLATPNADSDRFFVKTGVDPVTNQLQTGIEATLGVSANNLNFSAGIGPLVAKVTKGSANFGADVGKQAAGTPGFKVGDSATAPASFLFTLNDGFGGATAGGGVLTGLNLKQLGTPGNGLGDLLKTTINAAVDLNLPVSVLGQSLGPIQLEVGNLFNTTNVAGLPARSVHTAFPSLSGISLAGILNDPQAVIDGLDAILGTLAYGDVAKSIYSLDLPLIGPALQQVGSFFSKLHDGTVGTLQSMLDDFKTKYPGVPVTTQSLLTKGLEYVLTDVLKLPGSVVSFLDSESDPTELGFLWSFKTTLFEASVNLSSDLGIPGLGLSIDNGLVNLKAELSVNLGFGYSKTGGFFIYNMGTPNALANFTSNDDPANSVTKNFRELRALDLSIAAFLPTDPAFSATLSLGFLRLTATNGNTLTSTVGGTTYAGTSLTGSFYADIGPKDTDARLLFNEFSKGSILRVGLETKLNVDLILDAGLGIGSTNFALPSVTANLQFAYGFNKVFAGAIGNETPSGVITPLSFMNVTLDVGSFLSKVLKPIIDKVATVIEPLQPFLDFVTAPIPGLSEIIGDTSMLDLAEQYGGPKAQGAVKFIKILDQVSKLVTLIQSSSSGDAVKINFGNFTFGESSDPGTESVAGSNLDPFKSKLASADVSGATKKFTDNAAAGAAAASSAFQRLAQQNGSDIDKKMADVQKKDGAGGKPVFEFPILTNPMAILKMLMGQVDPVDLVKVTLPEFDLSFKKDLDFRFMVGPVPITVTVFFEVGVKINLTFGYDTRGIIKFINTDNPLMLLDGFYVQNTTKPQFSFYLTVGIKAGIDLGFAKAGVGGDITATINFTLSDVEGTGKIHASTLLTQLLDNPLQMFKIDGDLRLRIFAFAWVGVPEVLTIFDEEFTIIDVVLLEFEYDYNAVHGTPHLAHKEDDGKLTLNMGKNSDRQANGPNLKNDSQTFTIDSIGGQPGNQTVRVSANGVTREYTGVSEVVADLGDGNNNIRFNQGYLGNVTIKGGNGNNKIDLGGVDGDPLIQLGDGDNTIIGAAVDTTFIVGNGNNIITAGNTRNIITTGNGNNRIVGGSEQDTITVGSGQNTIWGGAGDDEIIAGTGNNIIYGGTGANSIEIKGGGNNTIFGHGPNDPTNTTAATVTATQVSANSVNTGDTTSTIIGGGGHDIIFGGGGDNSINGGAGRDIIFGALGTVTRLSDGTIVRMTSTGEDGGDNTITGTAGDKVIFGGPGTNSITGGAGHDIILAGGGTVDGASGGSGGVFTIISATIGSSSRVEGGVGSDVIIGTAGTNTLIGGSGDEVIGGHGLRLQRDASSGRDANVTFVETIDEGIGGNNSITGDGGSDIILAGAGSHNIASGEGSDVIIGHYGQITATNLGTVLTILGRNGAGPGNGDNTITAQHSAVIMGGGGNNTITTFDATSPADPINNLPAITSLDRRMVIFGANGYATVDLLVAGGIKIHQARTLVTEENAGGNNNITTGDGDNVILGGAGNNTITTGNGNSVVLGHTGAVDLDRLATPNLFGRAPDVIGRYLGLDGSQLSGTTVTITVGNGNNVVMGGKGNNTIITGSGNNAVFGAAGSVTRDGNNGNVVLYAETLEETLGGNNTIRAGLGAFGANLIFGGAGNNQISAGHGANIVFGHLGLANLASFLLYTDPQRADGSRPDLIARYVPERGSISPGAVWPTTGIDQAPPVTMSAITVGRGNNFIFGGAGNNVISAGDGNNAIFGAAGAVTRGNVSKAVVYAQTIEENLGGTHTILAGNGTNLIFGGAGYNTISAGSRNNIVFGHLGVVNYSVLTSFTPEQRAFGEQPDLVGRVLPTIGNIAPRTTDPFVTLDQPLAVAGSTIRLGNGANIVFGGAGDNTIVAGTGSNVIFGAGGAVSRDTRTGSIFFAETLEENQGGNNTIYAGLRAVTSQVIFGGPGTNTIQVGNGANIVLGHLGYVNAGVFNAFSTEQRLDGMNPDVVARIVPERGNITPATPNGWTGLDVAPTRGGSTITAGSGNNVIMGGAGDNTIYTGFGSNIVFGAAGQVSRDAMTLKVIHASTVEETQGGFNTLRLNPFGTNTQIAFGGPGGADIQTGYGRDIIFGHLGRVVTAQPDAAPAAGDLLTGILGGMVTLTGTIVPVIGNILPATTGPFAGLGTPPTAPRASIISGGEGNNIMFGGAGSNSITAGGGDNIVFSSAGQVVLNRVADTATPSLTEGGLATAATLTLGSGNNTVFSGPATGGGPVVIAAPVTGWGGTGPVALFSGGEAVSTASSLAQLAAAVSAPAVEPPGSGSSGTLIYDAATGRWVEDDEQSGTLLGSTAATPVLLSTIATPGGQSVAA